jgi:hypothetical protein
MIANAASLISMLLMRKRKSVEFMATSVIALLADASFLSKNTAPTISIAAIELK